MKLKHAPMLLAAGALCLGVAAAGCGDDDDKSSDSAAGRPAAKTEPGAGGADVAFVTPAEGSTTGSTVKVKLDLSGFKLAAKDVGKAPMEGEGHLHFSMDGGKYDVPKYSGANGELAEKLGVDGKYSPAVTPAITYTGLPKGEHTLKVDLANNNHSPTGKSATTTFTVE